MCLPTKPHLMIVYNYYKRVYDINRWHYNQVYSQIFPFLVRFVKKLISFCLYLSFSGCWIYLFWKFLNITCQLCITTMHVYTFSFIIKLYVIYSQQKKKKDFQNIFSFWFMLLSPPVQISVQFLLGPSFFQLFNSSVF